MYRLYKTARNNFWRFFYIFVFLDLFFSLGFHPFIVHAAYGVRLEGNRSFIEHSIKAGSVLEEHIFLENLDDQMKVSVFPVDMSKASDGIYSPKIYDKDSIFSRWVGSPLILTLAPRAVYAYNFQIAVPADAVNGVYRGSIVFEGVNDDVVRGGIKITSGVGIRMVITVTGGVDANTVKKINNNANTSIVNTVNAGATSAINIPNKAPKDDNWLPSPASSVQPSSSVPPVQNTSGNVSNTPYVGISPLDSSGSKSITLPSDSLPLQPSLTPVILSDLPNEIKVNEVPPSHNNKDFFIFTTLAIIFLMVLIFAWRGRASQ